MSIRKDNPAFSPEVARAGRRDIAVRDIQGWVKHRTEKIPEAGIGDYNRDTMIGALQIALTGYGESDAISLGVFEEKHTQTSFYDPSTQLEISTANITPQAVARVVLEWGRFGFRDSDLDSMRKEREEEYRLQDWRRVRITRAHHTQLDITKNDYYSIAGEVVPVEGKEDKFKIVIEDKEFEMPLPHDNKFGADLMEAIAQANPKPHKDTVHRRLDGIYR